MEDKKSITGQNDSGISFEITPGLEPWLLEAADTPVTPLTTTGFAAIREPD